MGYLNTLGKKDNYIYSVGSPQFFYADDFDDFTKEDNTKSEIVDKMLEMCVMDDLEGILITNNNKNIGRDSTVEFGWLVAIPEEVNSENLFHVKYSDLEKTEAFIPEVYLKPQVEMSKWEY